MITNLEQVLERRLTWPDTQPRAAQRVNGSFNRPSIDRALADIRDEMTRFRAIEFLVSRNSLRMFAGDPGVAVWWIPRQHPTTGAALRVLACDRFNTQGANGHAIALTLSAMRALERYGCYTMEQAAKGAEYLALPPAETSPLDWRVVFAMKDFATLPARDQLDMVQARYRRAQGDATDDAERQRLNIARDLAKAELEK